MTRSTRLSAWIYGTLGSALLAIAPHAARAADASQAPTATAAEQIAALSEREAADAAQIKVQAALIQQQAEELAKTRLLLGQQQQDLNAIKLATADLEAVRAAGSDMGRIVELPSSGAAAMYANDQATNPVGEAPPVHPNASLALPLPQGINVLTPRGHLIVDTALEYQNSSSDRLVFSGIQIINAIQIGLLQANQTSNDSGILIDTFRYGVGDRFEVELAVPWVVRADRVTTVQTVTPATDLTHVFNIRGGGIGDVEGTVRYQFNSGANGWPIVVGALRVISNTGVGPFDVRYNDQGVARKLSTGSGFWEINPNITSIYPLDPIVLFANVGYQHSFGRNINKTFGTGDSQIRIGKAQAGDSFSATVGFAFSLNSHFSYSLGYKENYFLPSTTVFLPTKPVPFGVKAKTLPLNDGALLLGGSYRVNNHFSFNLNFEFGVTPDAPNDTIVFRVPYLF